MKPVFLDTVGLLALWDKDDQWHANVSDAFDKLVRNRTPVVATSFVFLECANAASRRPYRQDVCQLRVQMETGGRLIHPTNEEWERAWIAYSNAEVDRAGVVDHISFLIMRRLKIHHAFTNDRHFKAAGFEVLF